MLFFVETVHFGNKLDNSFGKLIYNKWCGEDLHLNNITSVPSLGKVEERHVFLRSEVFYDCPDFRNSEKIIVELKSEENCRRPVFSIRKFKYTQKGEWQIVRNLGEFTTNEKIIQFSEQDSKGGGDALAREIANMTLIASFK